MKKIDYVFLSYLAVSTLFIVFAKDQSLQVCPLVLVRLLLLPLVFLLIYIGNKSIHPVVRLIRDAYPLMVSGYFYSETVHYNTLIFNNIDPLLIHLDEKLFGLQPSLVFSEVLSGKLFSELMYFGYFSFYLLIAGFIVYLFFRKRNESERPVFELTFGMYAFYFLFCIIPAQGPQFYFSYPQNAVPEGLLFASLVHFIQRIAEQPTGAFPSSHVGISFIILILSKRYIPRFFHLIWPVVLILILSTVYIKAHYAVDVFGGLIMAPLLLIVSGWLYKKPDRRNLEVST
ncbi:phosphatase PAP2 family protein [Saccharicrinis sp. FJH54]|uniref:phosphatase PAP2 family protein n=1 Tax=Saccharicrinis sp. FJH54 TaxID=3344665 RepID=UPI0035D52ACF